MKSNKKWDYSSCMEESKKYKTRLEFCKGSNGAYKVALQNNWLDEYVWIPKIAKAVKWVEEACYEEAKKYKSRNEFKKNAIGAYKAALLNNWINDYTWFTPKKEEWTFKKCYNIANNLSKRCHIYGIKILKINPKYSSFVGNFLFRHLGLPDMCLAAFELSRRTYEYFNQYITKQKEIKKNIIFPDVNKFKRFYMKSLEEFCIDNKFITLKKIYDFFKKDKKTYRLSISQDQQFIRCFSYRSKILHNFFI